MNASPQVLPLRVAEAGPARKTLSNLAVGQTLRLRLAGRTVGLTGLGGRLLRIDDPEFGDEVNAELLDPAEITPGSCLRFRVLGSSRIETSAPVDVIEP